MVETINKEVCFHCGLPIPENTHFVVVFDENKQPLCCAGCQAVAAAIIDNGLEQFYRHRDKKQRQAQTLVPDVLKELDLYNNPALQKSFVHQRTDDHNEASLILEGIVCAACVWLNERHVCALPGVIAFHVNYATHRAQLVWDDNQIQLAEVLKSITEIGYHAHPFDPNRQQAIHKKERSLLIRQLGVAAIGMMQVMMLAIALYIGAYQGMADNITTLLRWASLVITIPVIFYSGKLFFVSAWRDLKNKRLGMDVPIAIAIGAAFIASCWATISGSGEVYFDSVVMFTFFLLVGRFLEQTARHKAGDMADELVKLVPAVAHLQTDNSIEVVPVMELVIGDRVLVKAGESVPADGIVMSGETHVDESLITGESRPVFRAIGDLLIAGSVNQDTSISIEVSQIGEDTTLASISRLLERAQAQKPHVAILANRVASWFVAALLLVAASVFGYWHYIRGSEDAFWIMLSVLVVTCPCALSLATPVALTAVTGVLTKMGVLTTRGHAIETLASITDVIFDKTGTLTTGEQTLVSVNPLAVDKDTALHLAGTLESHSTHPVARVFKPWQHHNARETIAINDVKGLGVEGVFDGKKYRLGSQRFIDSWGVDTTVNTPLEAGLSRIWLADEHVLLALFDIGDTLRDESAAIVKQLQQRDIRVHLLSGDQATTVRGVAETLGIDHFRAEQMPEDKLTYLQQRQQGGSVVAMVGDGINDAQYWRLRMYLWLWVAVHNSLRQAAIWCCYQTS